MNTCYSCGKPTTFGTATPEEAAQYATEQGFPSLGRLVKPDGDQPTQEEVVLLAGIESEITKGRPSALAKAWLQGYIARSQEDAGGKAASNPYL